MHARRPEQASGDDAEREDDGEGAAREEDVDDVADRAVARRLAAHARAGSLPQGFPARRQHVPAEARRRRLRHVHPEAAVRVVPADVGVDGVAGEEAVPGPDGEHPRLLAVAEVERRRGRVLDVEAVRVDDERGGPRGFVPDHAAAERVAVVDLAPHRGLVLGFRVALCAPRGEGDVLAVLAGVGDEHKRAGHRGARADGDPRVARRRGHVEVDVAIRGAGSQGEGEVHSINPVDECRGRIETQLPLLQARGRCHKGQDCNSRQYIRGPCF